MCFEIKADVSICHSVIDQSSDQRSEFEKGLDLSKRYQKALKIDEKREMAHALARFWLI